RSELCRRAAEARWLAGDERGAVALGRAALDEPDVRSQPTRSAFIQERLATYLWGSGDSEGGLRAAQGAVASLPASPPTADLARALCGEGRMLLMRGDNERARAVCEHALSIARAAGDQAQEGQALNYLAGATAFLGGHDEAIAYLEQAVRIAHETTVGARGCPEYENLSEVLAESRRTKDGLEIALEGVRVARELGVEHSYGVVLLGRAALCSLLLGRLHEADQHCAQALELGAASFFGANALEAGARCAIMHGDFEAADRHLQLARGMTSRMRDLMWAGPIAGVSSELELWLGRPERAVAIVNATLAIAPERECPQHSSELHANGTRAHADLAQAARATGQGDLLEQSARAAEVLERRLADLLARSLPLGHPGATTEVHAALCTAEVARATGSSPIDAWQDALETCEVIGHRSRGAYAGWRLAEALLEGGQRDRAEAVLVEAVGVAAEIGFEPLGTELHALARRGRIKLGEGESGRSPANRGALLGLTHRELEVLALLAEGRTNRQIAGQLYITEKTTEHHVSRILGKLDVRTRGEAGAVAHRLGLNTAANAQW
ncbi:MAG: LuxR C-terminal-related transcriptional regulator, partial [Solirubrobacteraceae bacterium]